MLTVKAVVSLLYCQYIKFELKQYFVHRAKIKSRND